MISMGAKVAALRGIELHNSSRQIVSDENGKQKIISKNFSISANKNILKNGLTQTTGVSELKSDEKQPEPTTYELMVKQKMAAYRSNQ